MVLGVAFLVLLGITFGFGVLVGRHRVQPAHQAVGAEASRKLAATPRRSGLSEAGAERLPHLQEKLTFYQTLKAPLGPVRMPEAADAAAKPTKAPVSPGRPPERAGQGTASRPPDRDPQGISRPATVQTRPTSERNETSALSSAPRDGERREAAAWTVQVGVFTSPQQAAGVQKQLAAKGFEAQIAPTMTDDGHVWYRVRLGAFKSREEAVRTAERVRSDRSLPTYVTTR